MCNVTCKGCNITNGICDKGCQPGWSGLFCQDGIFCGSHYNIFFSVYNIQYYWVTITKLHVIAIGKCLSLKFWYKPSLLNSCPAITSLKWGNVYNFANKLKSCDFIINFCLWKYWALLEYHLLFSLQRLHILKWNHMQIYHTNIRSCNVLGTIEHFLTNVCLFDLERYQLFVLRSLYVHGMEHKCFTNISFNIWFSSYNYTHLG